MRIRKISVLFVLFLFTYLQSCNEEPTGLGFLLLNDTISVKSVCSDREDIIVKTEIVRVPKVIFNSSCVYVGKTDSMRAVSMLRFQNIPDSLADLPLEDIIDCYIELYPNSYAIGDTAANNLTFNVFKIVKYWTAETICDSLFDSNGNSDYFDNISQGIYSDPIPIIDSINSIKFNINKELMLEWFAMARDSITNWGIVLMPDDNKSNVIRQFWAQTIGEEINHAEITMIYHGKDDIDTLKMNTAIDASVVCNTPPETDNMIIQGGIINKSRISFDLSMIPPTSGILSAELTITINNDFVKKGTAPLDSIIKGAVYYFDDLDSNPKMVFYARREEGGDKFVFPNLISLVEEAIRTDGKSEIIIEAEGWSLVRKLDRLPFFGTKEQNPDLRPKLRVIYTTGLRN